MGFNKHVTKCDPLRELPKVKLPHITWLCSRLDDFIECIIIDRGREKVYVYRSSILASRTARNLIIPRVFTCMRPVLALTFDDKIQVLWTILIYRRKNVWCFFFTYTYASSWKIVLTSYIWHACKSRQSDTSFGLVKHKQSEVMIWIRFITQLFMCLILIAYNHVIFHLEVI